MERDKTRPPEFETPEALLNGSAKNRIAGGTTRKLQLLNPTLPISCLLAGDLRLCMRRPRGQDQNHTVIEGRAEYASKICGSSFTATF
jgi:hypothetical protein